MKPLETWKSIIKCTAAIRNTITKNSLNTIQMIWWVSALFISVIVGLYLLRRYELNEGFQDASVFDKASMCPVLAEQINRHVSKEEGLKQENAVHSLSIHNEFLNAYRKKYSEMGCT